VCCSVLQCVAVCCSVLQCVAVCCSVLQCVAVCCSVLQCVVDTRPTCTADEHLVRHMQAEDGRGVARKNQRLVRDMVCQ